MVIIDNLWIIVTNSIYMWALCLTLSFCLLSKVYPTTVRAVAVGTFSSIARLGAMVTPYVAQVMMPEVSQIGALCLYASITALVALLSIFLPIETKGRQLPVNSVMNTVHLMQPMNYSLIHLIINLWFISSKYSPIQGCFASEN
ncbi:unnamed protein product [Trichobilharzia regenti]|nr:unnamed protein product [Trichobilharzia regenti]